MLTDLALTLNDTNESDVQNLIEYIVDLEPSPSWKLLIENGGSLTREKYFGPNKYVSTGIRNISQTCASENFGEYITLL
jgi:hypothetical protein